VRRPVDLHEQNERAWAIGQARLKVVSGVAAQPRVGKETIDAAAREMGVSRAYCYRLLRRFRDSPTASALAPGKVGRGPGSKVLPSAIEAPLSGRLSGAVPPPGSPPPPIRQCVHACCRESFGKN
jgi:Helix-turn-helix domain